MEDRYGDFSEIITQLNGSLSSARAEWKDQTAITYDHLNEGMEEIVAGMWRSYSQSQGAHDGMTKLINSKDIEGMTSSAERTADEV